MGRSGTVSGSGAPRGPRSGRVPPVTTTCLSRYSIAILPLDHCLRGPSLRRIAPDSERRDAARLAKAEPCPLRGRFFGSAVLSWGDFLMPDTAYADRRNVAEVERAASGLGGTALLCYCLARPSPPQKSLPRPLCSQSP